MGIMTRLITTSIVIVVVFFGGSALAMHGALDPLLKRVYSLYHFPRIAEEAVCTSTHREIVSRDLALIGLLLLAITWLF